MDIEVIGLSRAAGLDGDEIKRLSTIALASVKVEEGHLAIEFVGPERIRELNRRYRGIDSATDVLSFGLDQAEPTVGPRELGDVVICPDYVTDLRQAVLHGVLHLVGMDHEEDQGEMLMLELEILRWVAAA